MSLKHSMENLAKANESRYTAARYTAAMERGEKTLADVFDEPLLQGHRLGRVLTMQPRVGKALGRRWLKAARILPGFWERPIRDLTERQRTALLTLAEAFAQRREERRDGRRNFSRGGSVYEAER